MKKILFHPVTIGISSLFCAPIGIGLVWNHPTWQNRTKWIWTGFVVVIVAVLYVGQNADENSNIAQMEKAHVTWDQGNKKTACEEYVDVIGGTKNPFNIRPPFNDHDMSLMYGRIIEHYLEEGYTAKAKEVYQNAVDDGFTPLIKEDLIEKLNQNTGH